MLTPEIKTKINQLWDKFWSGGIANPLTAIEQISYLLFMKRLDEMDKENKKTPASTGEKYKSIFSGKLNELSRGGANTFLEKDTFRWSSFKKLEPSSMLKFVSDYVFPFIKELNSEEYPFARSMKDAVFMIPKPSLLDEAVKIIDSIYDEIEKQRKGGQIFHDTLGDVYEFLLNEISVSGKNGQFRTPPAGVGVPANIFYLQLRRKRQRIILYLLMHQNYHTEFLTGTIFNRERLLATDDF